MKAEPTSSTSHPAADQAAFTRLHITPFDPQLLDLVIPAAIRPLARNISFHAVQTFPEKRYGFVELPIAEAAKVKKRLHGAVLRGSKIRIEPAKHDDMPKPASDAALAGAAPRKQAKLKSRDESKKKRKRESAEIIGVELEDGRQVKRGWTVPEDTVPKKERGKKAKKTNHGKKDAKSLYTDQPEALVKTILPAGTASALQGESVPKKRKKGKAREVVVHEFEKSTKFPTFLKSTAPASKSDANLEYIDGKGWVDEAGDVVEKARTKTPLPAMSKEEEGDDDDSTSSSGESSDADHSTAQSEPETAMDIARVGDDDTLPPKRQTVGKALESPRPKSSGSGRSLTIKIPPPVTPAAGKVHPLEALYKRAKQDMSTPAQGTASETKPFSFFEADTDDAEAPGSQVPPMTPFTQEEFELRRVRSAAPTPDTAHPNRTFKLWPVDGEKEDDIEEEEEEDADAEMGGAQAARGKGGEEGEEGEEGIPTTGTGGFQAWFWEHRGDLNRSWKKRRKTAAKEKRYRENRSRSDRAI